MLTPTQFDSIGKQASYIYNQLELEIIEEIATRIANVGYANTVVLNNITIAQEMGLLYQEIITLVAKYNSVSESKVKEIFEEAGAKSIAYDDRIYKEAGLNPVPIKQSRSMMQLMAATIEKTNANLNNLVMTTANTSQTQFYNAMNKAHMEVSTGVKSYSQSIIDTIKEISSQGAYIEYPSGQHRSIESAVRTNILTSVNQTCGKLQELRANDMNWDLMELTAHAGARPEHAEWQGKIVSISGQKGYLSLKDIGYGEVTGFKGVNCRHDWMPYHEGSTRTYTDDELEKLKNETVTYNGQKISKYDASQLQRKMERQIRQDKRDLAGLQGILSSNTTDNKLIEETKTEFAKKSLYYNNHKNKLEYFLQQTEYKRDNSRLVVANYTNDIARETGNVMKIANKYNKGDIIGTVVNGVEITEISEHIISRTYARGLSYEDVANALKKPLGYGKIKVDKQGRRSFEVIGEKVTVCVNPDTGKTTTTHATHTQIAEKLKKENEANK